MAQWCSFIRSNGSKELEHISSGFIRRRTPLHKPCESRAKHFLKTAKAPLKFLCGSDLAEYVFFGDNVVLCIACCDQCLFLSQLWRIEKTVKGFCLLCSFCSVVNWYCSICKIWVCRIAHAFSMISCSCSCDFKPLTLGDANMTS